MLTGTSCTVVRQYPENRPFHFENNIKIEANLSRDEKADIKSRLLAQIDDSAQIRVASKIPWPSFPFFIPVSVMENPTIFTETPLKQSVFNMRNLMSSIGFRRTEIRFDTTVIVKKNNKGRYPTLLLLLALGIHLILWFMLFLIQHYKPSQSNPQKQQC